MGTAMREATRLPDMFVLLNDQLPSARGAGTEPRAQRAAKYGLALANPDRPRTAGSWSPPTVALRVFPPGINPSSLPRGRRSPR
jgi:hypothetical protein